MVVALPLDRCGLSGYGGVSRQGKVTIMDTELDPRLRLRRDTVRLADFDLIAVSVSGGKDSQAMLDLLVGQARAEGVADRLVLVHADLGRVEWEGTRELVEGWAREYGLRLEVVSRPQGDLLEHVEQRGKWPSSAARYCTSDHKRGQIRKVYTRLVSEFSLGRPVRILECLGFRVAESPARAKREPVARNDQASNGKREVTTWLPIHEWSEADVWDRIGRAPTASHPAYDLGMPRLSCVFCVLAPKDALVLAAQHNPTLAREYAAVEARIGHTFKRDLSMAEVVAEAEAGVEVGGVQAWVA